METVIILEGSEYYEFIHVEQYGYVKSYNPKTTSGDHHHLMFIRGEDEMEVHLPIKPKAPGEQVSCCQFFCHFKNATAIIRANLFTQNFLTMLLRAPSRSASPS